MWIAGDEKCNEPEHGAQCSLWKQITYLIAISYAWSITLLLLQFWNPDFSAFSSKIGEQSDFVTRYFYLLAISVHRSAWFFFMQRTTYLLVRILCLVSTSLFLSSLSFSVSLSEQTWFDKVGQIAKVQWRCERERNRQLWRTCVRYVTRVSPVCVLYALPPFSRAMPFHFLLIFQTTVPISSSWW